jgi:uncharacterized membrane protein
MSPTEHPPHEAGAHRARAVEDLISVLLRTGVLSSLVLVLCGLAVSFVQHPEYRHSHQAFVEMTHGGHGGGGLGGLLAGLGHGRGESIIALGLLVLIATPVMRVALSLLIFVHQRDRIFAVITTVVLLLLLVGFVLGRVEG